MPRFEGTQVHADTWSPLVQVEFRNDSGGLITTALVDSGADCTIIPAELLDLIPDVAWDDLEQLANSVGAGGGFECKRLQVTARFQDRTFATQVHVAEKGRLPWVLLGRSDFFATFVVRFAWHRQPPTFDIDPVAK